MNRGRRWCFTGSGDEKAPGPREDDTRSAVSFRAIHQSYSASIISHRWCLTGSLIYPGRRSFLACPGLAYLGPLALPQRRFIFDGNTIWRFNLHCSRFQPPLRGVLKAAGYRGFRFASPPATFGQALRAYVTATRPWFYLVCSFTGVACGGRRGRRRGC